MFNLDEFAAVKYQWSTRTFGYGLRTRGICEHIRKELVEIEAEPTDLSEWIDVILLAIDGYYRHGGRILSADLTAKQAVNVARKWTEPRGDEPTEHIREDVTR